MQVSLDLNILDLDIPFAFMFSLAASLNAYSNLGVLAVVKWEVLLVSVPMVVLATRLQVIGVTSFLYWETWELRTLLRWLTPVSWVI
jgi:hypothetical protein